MFQSRYNSLKLYILYNRTNTLVCINPDTAIFVFLSMYLLDTAFAGTLYSPLILKSISIQIQHSLYSLICIFQKHLALWSLSALYTINNFVSKRYKAKVHTLGSPREGKVVPLCAASCNHNCKKML